MNKLDIITIGNLYIIIFVNIHINKLNQKEKQIGHVINRIKNEL